MLGGVATLAMIASASAQTFKIGATLSLTGPAASIGIPIKKVFEILPKELNGVPVSWTILDDGSDTTAARRNAEKLAAEGVDLIVGGNTTPTALATVEIAGRSKTPTLAIAPSPVIIDPIDAAREWVFKVPQGERELADATLRAMSKAGVKSFGFIGFNDAFGEGWLKEFALLAPTYKIKTTTVEKFARTDTSVEAQTLKVMASAPEAVFVGATSTPAALPVRALRDRGFKGPIYATSGTVNADFIRVGGKAAEGVLVAGSPGAVAQALPSSNPSKNAAMALTELYQNAYKGELVSLFAGNAYDVWLLVESATKSVGTNAKPGSLEYRSALRDALEGTTRLATTNGVVNMSKTNHGFFSADSALMLKVSNGAWALAN